MAVKKFGEFGQSQPIRQSFFRDEARDHTICVTERTRMLNIYVAQRSYKVPYKIKRQLLNDDLYSFINATLSGQTITK